MGRTINFVALNGRRAILSSALLPALLPMDPASAKDAAPAGKAAKAAPAPPPPPKPIIVSRSSGGSKYSFTLPNKDFVEQNGQPSDEAYYVRKDNSFVTIKMGPKGAARKKLNARAGPGNGFKLENFQEGAKQDDLEWTKLPTIAKGAFGGGAQPGGFLFIGQGDADDTSYHQWYRTLHTPNGDAVITAAVNSDAFEKDEKMFRKMLDSFKLD